ncbi:MAG: MFS transporter, partial [Sneathiella sp.]
RFDFQGLFSLIGGLGLFVFGLMQGPEWGWKDPAVWGCLVVGGLLFAVFVAIELRVKRPLIEVDLFANASFAVCNFVVFTAQYSKIVIFIFGAAYLQKNLEMTALEAGTALLASVIFSPPMGLVAGKVADRFGARGPTLIGLVAVTSALLWIGVASEWQSYLLLLPGLLIWGSAIPLLFVPPMRAVMNEVPADKKGLAGGIVLCAQLLGGTMGVAISSTLFLTTRDYSVVFLATGALAAFALLLGFLKIEPEKIEAA